MKSIIKFLFKIIGFCAAIYGILFAIFYFDLDGKFLYYIWEPMMVKRYDNMKRRDNTDIPYLGKEKVAPEEYTQII
ncbi:MAG: hypothetical protein K6G10_10915 [Butyrivibrio sp.]|nr:hypothetical protein [Butyrivibrio sp.]